MKKENITYLKIMILVFGLNAIIYLGINHIVSSYHLLEFSIDKKIPFVPGFIWIYSIWYPFIITSLYIIYKYNKNDFFKTMLSIVIGFVVSYSIFLIFPTTVNRPIADSYNSLTSFLLYATFKMDNPVNCFPSNHALLCFLLLFTTIKNKNIPLWFRIFSFILNILIILSTLFVKQHVVIDLIGSLTISLIIYYIMLNLNISKKFINKIINSL